MGVTLPVYNCCCGHCTLLQASKSKDKDGDESTQRKVKEAQKEELDRQNKLQTNMALKAALGGGARWQNFGKAKAAGAAAVAFSSDFVHTYIGSPYTMLGINAEHNRV